MVAQQLYNACLADVKNNRDNDEAVLDLFNWLGGWPLVDDNASNSSVETIEGRLALLGLSQLILPLMNGAIDRSAYMPASKVELTVSIPY